jgi:hypothetical protein
MKSPFAEASWGEIAICVLGLAVWITLLFWRGDR